MLSGVYVFKKENVNPWVIQVTNIWGVYVLEVGGNTPYNSEQ